MQADDDLSSFQQLVEHAEALQHDVEQAEHHRQTVDNCDPYDAARLELVHWAAKHAGVLNDVGFCVEFLDGSYVAVDCGIDGVSAFISAFDRNTGSFARRIPLN